MCGVAAVAENEPRFHQGPHVTRVSLIPSRNENQPHFGGKLRSVSADLHAAASDRLQNAEGRYTSARRRLVDVLAGAGQPLTVTEICGASGLPPSSVYRNLGVLEEVGVVHRLAGHDEFARFELAEELVGHHHHLACRECGAMTDVHLPSQLEGELDRVLTRIARAEGFELSSHVLDAVGTCRACSEAAAGTGAPTKGSRRSVS